MDNGEMPQRLAALRRDLDLFPSSDRRRPGLIIRDQNGFSPQVLIVPPGLVEALRAFDGEQTDSDLRLILTQITGELDVAELADHLQQTLSDAGFLEDDQFAALRDARLAQWRAEQEIRWAHSGPGNYPDSPSELKETFDTWFGNMPNGAHRSPICAIAAPHASPGAARRSYVAAYGALAGSLSREHAADKTFVILGTSHYGEPDRLGATCKDFLTPWGSAKVNTGLLEFIRKQGGAGVLDEDYCFSIEHSIEFQVVFLQYLYGPDVRILPLLCGTYGRSFYRGDLPEDQPEVRRYIETLGELQAAHGDSLVWVLGVDMAHMGERYSDRMPAEAHRGAMEAVTERDRMRIAAINAGDADGFWEQVRENQDDLKWCGSAPFYTYLRAAPAARGELLDYDHWQIDPASVVTFGAMRFQAP